MSAPSKEALLSLPALSCPGGKAHRRFSSWMLIALGGCGEPILYCLSSQAALVSALPCQPRLCVPFKHLNSLNEFKKKSCLPRFGICGVDFFYIISKIQKTSQVQCSFQLYTLLLDFLGKKTNRFPVAGSTRKGG